MVSIRRYGCCDYCNPCSKSRHTLRRSLGRVNGDGVTRALSRMYICSQSVEKEIGKLNYSLQSRYFIPFSLFLHQVRLSLEILMSKSYDSVK